MGWGHIAARRPTVLLAVVQRPQTLRHGDRLVGPELSLLRTESLHTAPSLPQGCSALAPRVSASKTLLSGRARYSNPLSMRSGANLRHVVKLWKFRQVLHRDDPERLRRHLHVVVATFDGRWQVHSPALGADVAAADLKLVQEQRPLVTQGLRSTAEQHVRAGHHGELVQTHVAGCQATCQGVFPVSVEDQGPSLVASSFVACGCFWWTSGCTTSSSRCLCAIWPYIALLQIFARTE